jgi:hypothetical protein
MSALDDFGETPRRHSRPPTPFRAGPKAVRKLELCRGVEASLQLSIDSYATAMNGPGDAADLRLRFAVLTKTRQPELHRYWTDA